MTKFFTSSGTRIIKTRMISDVRAPSVMARFGTASTAASDATSCTALMSVDPLPLNPLDDGSAKQAGRLDDENRDDKRQRDRQFQFVADAGDISAGEIFDDAHQKA